MSKYSRPAFWNALVQLALRMLPLIPGPEIYALIRSVRQSQEDADQQVAEAVEALSKSSRLIDNLGLTLREREKKLKELKSEYERVSALSSLTAEQGEAVARSLEAVLGKNRIKEHVYAFAIHIIAGLILFIIGVFLSDWVKSLYPF